MPRLSKIGAAALAAFGWTSGAPNVTVDFLVVAGGGSAASRTDAYSGGGGGGGFRTSSGTSGGGGSAEAKLSLSVFQSYTIVVGAGGATTTVNVNGIDGSSSSISGSGITTITSVGGGGGATNDQSGRAGGSGGGAGGNDTATTGGAGTTNQGYAGGNHAADPATGGAGGGGAGGVGGNSEVVTGGGTGGAGLANSLSGSSVFYSAGGGGLLGAFGFQNNGANGTGWANLANRGNGGNNPGGNKQGSSGIVIISYPSPQKFGGGIVTISGANTIHTFTTSGTLSPLSSLSASYLIVAGGAGGGAYIGGGGGAGGLLSGSGVTIDTNSTYLVTVGAGGAGGINTSTAPLAGSNSAFSMVTTTAVGGGIGGYWNGSVWTVGGNGGSGGGGGLGTLAGGTGTSGQGFAGGTGAANTGGTSASAGGGGAGAVGGNGATSVPGNGGVGVASSISGASTFYAGGGGGSAHTSYSNTSTGGNGGGGAGGQSNSGGAVAGTANTGGGGGGNGVGYNGAAGGSGIVIISYAGSTQLMAGGTVTISGGNVIHTFRSSGYLTPLTLVGNSLRFRASNSAYLSRTNTNSPTNNKICTWSFWFKNSQQSANAWITGTGTAGTSTTEDSLVIISSTQTLYCELSGTSTGSFQTTQVFRDPAAWYHIVVAYDTTQATNTNRIKLYVNGIQVTSFSSISYPALNATLNFGGTQPQSIGRRQFAASNYLDGYLTEINFIDGQGLTPNSFGTFNQFGVWQPIRYGGSYGTNGFYLPFNANATSYAGSFNGSSQYLNLGGQSNFAFGTGNFTIEFYVNASTFSNQPVIYDARPAATNGAYSTIYVNTAGALIYYTNSAIRITSPQTMRINTWNHVAVVRSGTTTTLYLNGISQGAYSDSLNYLVGANRPIISASNATGSFLTGALSNLRVNKGTAVYTSSFIPSTTPLTAITNTQLLTLQNATIVDNSTNAFSITNTGTVTTAQTYPLAISVFNDKGPAGNNWTPNNISGIAGTTLDYMTDVPTLTSTTAANYAVMNPLDAQGTATLTDGNLTLASSSTTHRNRKATFVVPSTGKWYWELTTASTCSSSVILGWGLQTTAAPNNSQAGNANTFMAQNDANQDIFNQTTTVLSTGSAVSGGSIRQVAYDADSGKLWFGVNNTWYSSTDLTSGNPSAGTNPCITLTSGSYFPAVTCYNLTANVNFGQRPFSYTPPTGFLPLNTFNL